MEAAAAKDREILREIARKHLELANSAANEKVLKKWKWIEQGKSASLPFVFLCPILPMKR